MPRTRKQEAAAAEKEPVPDQPEQKESAPENPPATSEPTPEKKDNEDAAAKASDRLQRFKSLQARAVSQPYI